MITVSSISFSNIQTQNRNKKSAKNNLDKFGQIRFKSNPIQVLEKQYFSLIKNSKLRPTEAFFSISAEKPVLKNLFTNIMENESSAFEFISDAIKNPRESLDIAHKISNKISDESVFLTFSYNSPYSVAYKKFIDKKFDEAKSIEELLAIRPDWYEKKLFEKNQALNKKSFELGEVPQGLLKEDLNIIINHLKKYMQSFGAKSPTQIESLNISGRNYNFTYFIDGKTDKNVFGIDLPNGKKYIIKMAKEDKRSLEDPFALGTLAKIDMYMTLNKSRNTAPILYYNHDKNFLIYEYIEHTAVDGDTRNLSIISQHIPDYKELGLQFNDNVGSNNCFLLNEKSNPKLKFSHGFYEGIANGEWISIDNDHVTYANILNPQIQGMHSYLPYAMQYCV